MRKSQWKKSRIVERALHIIRRGSLSRIVCDVVYTSKLFSFVCAKMMTPFDIHLYSTPVTIHMSPDTSNQIKRAFETNKTMNGTHNRISSSNGIEQCMYPRQIRRVYKHNIDRILTFLITFRTAMQLNNTERATHYNTHLRNKRPCPTTVFLSLGR